MDLQIFSVCQVTVGVECDQPQQGLQLQRLWRTLFSLVETNLPASAPTVCFQFKRSAQQLDPPALEQEISRSGHLSVWTTPDGFYLQCGSSVLDLDLTQSRVVGRLDRAFWDYALEEQREFFMLAFLMLLHRHGRYGLHANGVVKKETGCLIVGSAGQGKTTLTLGLVKAGWNYLADDAVMLHHTSGNVEALALRRGFSCTPQTMSHFPELGAAAEEALGLADGKKLVVLDGRYPGRFAPRCAPQALLFPEIVDRSCSQLIPIDATAAMTGLIKQSPGIMNNQVKVPRQLAVLNQLTAQAPSYRILLGTDVYQEPEKVSALLLEGCGG